MEEPVIINMMRNMTVDGGIVLEDVHHFYPNTTKLYRGRPEMLIMKMKNGRNLQMFRKGKAQILGHVSEGDAENMRHEFIAKLRRLKTMQSKETRRVSEMIISNMVMSVQLKKKLCPNKVLWSDSNVFHETELFPATLIRKWHPVHIALFHNGKVILTGLKSTSDFYNAMNLLNVYLESSHFFCEIVQ